MICGTLYHLPIAVYKSRPLLDRPIQTGTWAKSFVFHCIFWSLKQSKAKTTDISTTNARFFFKSANFNRYLLLFLPVWLGETTLMNNWAPCHTGWYHMLWTLMAGSPKEWSSLEKTTREFARECSFLEGGEWWSSYGQVIWCQHYGSELTGIHSESS